MPSKQDPLGEVVCGLLLLTEISWQCEAFLFYVAP